MNYSEELVKQWAEEISNTAKQSTTCSYVIPYNRVDSFDPTDRECQKDVLEYLWDFKYLDDNLQAVDFDDKNQHIVVMWYEPPTKENIEEDKEMNYQEQIKKAVQEFYDVTKAFATSRHYTLSYWWVESNFGLDLNDKQIRSDVHEMTYSDEFCDLIQTVDFDDDKKEVLIMIWESNNKKKYTIDNYEEFSKNALAMPPIEQFEDGSIDEEQWYKDHMIHITVGNHDIELDYHADNVNEIGFVLREMYEVEKDYKYATTGNTIGSEYRNATWKDILRFYVLDKCYNTSNSLKSWVKDCIKSFSREDFRYVMKEINEQTSINDELKINFTKLDTTDLWKIFDQEERRQGFKEILCSDIRIEELYDEKGRCADKVVITDYSIKPSGDIVGWHYGVDWDKDSEDNQYYIENYIEGMIG
jgi:hypothetical protein